MLTPNLSYANLKESYLFHHIAGKTEAYLRAHPGAHLYRMGIGDASLPLAPAVIQALHRAVDDQAEKESFHGYMPECGAPFLREAIAAYYQKRKVQLSADEVFVSSGASDELGDLLDLFDRKNRALIMEPAYPAYVDANIMAGRDILHLPSGPENHFLPLPEDGLQADLIYICSPNNPTGAAYDRDQLSRWVRWANGRGAVILFDAAYEAFIEEKIPKELERSGLSLNAMWVRNRTTKTNGISYILQRGGAAVFTEEGQRQIHENIRVYKENARVLMNTLDEAGIRYWGGRNAPYIWMECPDGQSSWAFFDRLLNGIQVVGTPGEGFGSCGEGFFRFSTFGDPGDTREAAGRLLKLLKQSH